MDYRREIDGLRAIAVVPVILFHADFASFGGGFVGVDVFFVISGYLITSIILREKENGSFSLKNFYERRARRILPALFCVILFTLPFAWFLMLPGQLKSFAMSIAAVSVFASNVLFWRESNYFDPITEEKPLLHTWSLAVEEQYYVVFPLLIILLWPFGRRWLLAVIGLGIALSLGLAEWGWRYQAQANFFLAPTRAWELLIGSVCAFYLLYRTEHKSNQWFSLLGMGLIVSAIFMFDKQTPIPSLWGLMPVLGTVLVILYGSAGTVTARFLSLPLLVGLGLISYSAYLWHQPLFAFARIAGEFEHGVPLILIGLSFAFAWLTWRFVEVPFRNRNLIGLKRFLPAFIAAYVAVNGFALASVATSGFVGRYAPEDRFLATLDPSEQGSYVMRRFGQITLKEFVPDGALKLLIIGDSFGEDVVNALYESGNDQYFQLSTFSIPVICGNLYLEEGLSSNVHPSHVSRCSNDGGYDNMQLRQRMVDADVIWLVSSWKRWQAELLPRSLENIRKITDAKLLVLGTKTFGKIDFKSLIDLDVSERSELRKSVRVDVNDMLRDVIAQDSFIDTQSLLCGANYSCPVFTPESELISFDGGHLTKAGARFLGRKLIAHPLIATDIVRE